MNKDEIKKRIEINKRAESIKEKPNPNKEDDFWFKEFEISGKTKLEKKTSGSGTNRVCTIRARTKDNKFIKTIFRTSMSIPFYFGVSIHSMVAIMGDRIGNDNFMRDVLANFYVSGICYDTEKYTLQIKLELLKCFYEAKYKIFEDSGLFPVNVLEFVFLSHF